MRLLAALALAIGLATIAPAASKAGERVLDGALGAATGAIVFGPVGLVAGGLTGYVAGPSIACGLGVKRCYHHRHRARYKRYR